MHSIFISPVQSRLEWFRKSIEEMNDSSFDFDYQLELKKEISASNEHVLFYDLLDSPDEASFTRLSELASKFNGRIVAVGNAQSSTHVLRSLRAGACDYLDTTHLDSDLNQVWKRLVKNSNEKPSEGRIVLVMAANGGVGKSTIAANLAIAANLSHKTNVCLVDFDFDHGDLSAMLHLDPQFTVADLIRPNIALDQDMFERTLTQYEKTGVRVLAAPSNVTTEATYSEDSILKTLDYCRENFPLTIVDMPSGYNEMSQRIISRADMVLVVNRLDFQSIRNTARFLDFQTRQCKIPAGKFKVIVNRKGEPFEVEMEKAEEVVGSKLEWVLPNDPKSANLACNVGVPVVIDSPSSNLTHAFHQIAGNLLEKFHLIQRTPARAAASGLVTRLPSFIASFMM
jgi:pilus assembly protein CpaE